MRDIKRLVHEKLDAVSIADWTSRVRRVREIDTKMKHLKGLVDIEPITFTLSDSDSSEDETSCKENDC